METWKPVPGYEGIYEVSDHGNVRIICARPRSRPGKTLLQTPNKAGYLRVNLNDGVSTTKTRFVHRLVVAAFLGLAEGYEVNHRNGAKADNRLENLEVVTRSENIRHSIDTLGNRHWGIGEAHGRAKLKDSDIVQIRERAATGEDFAAIGRDFGISGEQTSLIARGIAWPHVGGPLVDKRPSGHGAKAKGERNPSARLTVDQVVKLRERAAAGEHFGRLAKVYGISNVAASAIARGKTWGHVGGPRVESRAGVGRPRK